MPLFFRFATNIFLCVKNGNAFIHHQRKKDYNALYKRMHNNGITEKNIFLKHFFG
jgi:hypothetical protein